jgi:hypothetical protein
VGGDQWCSWRKLLKGGKETLRLTEDQLLINNVIRRSGSAITIIDEERMAQLQASVRSAHGIVNDEGPPPVDVAALACLAAVIPVTMVASEVSRRRHRDRLAPLTNRVEAEMNGFADLVTRMRRTRRRAFSAGGHDSLD